MLQNSPLYAYIPARDVKRARQFYESKLGLKPKEETAAGWSTSSARAPRASRTRPRTPALRRQRGVRFEEYDMADMKPKNGIYSGGGAKAAWFKDSEANILAAIQNEK
jgi:catechol 2,3-dioxygenase-like lactoylglutathione lyase family enzyme